MKPIKFLPIFSLFVLVFIFSGVIFAFSEGLGVNDYSLYLNSGTITGSEVLKQSKELVAQEVYSNELKLYILQFNGPITEAQKQTIGQAGVELGDYLPNFAFLVRTTPSIARKLPSLSFIHGIIRYEPAMKISRELTTKNTRDELKVQIATFGENQSSLVARDSRVISRAKRSLTAKLKQTELMDFAKDENIIRIEEVSEYKMCMDIAAKIVNAPAAWECSLTGEGQLIGISDTGLDKGFDDATMSPDFQGRIAKLYALGRPDDASDPNGHGTHVAGIALGSGVNSQGQFKGIAPGAKVVFQSVMDEKGKNSGIPYDISVLFEQTYQDGARVHTNSWCLPVMAGGAVYNINSHQVDRFMWEHKDMLILFAAGNDGDYDFNWLPNYNTINTPGTAKNCLTVGASENYRPDMDPGFPVHISDNANEVAIFSSRGGAAPDNRIKPELVAPGTMIVSARSSLAPEANFYFGIYNDYYAYMCGTSMSSPLVAGAAAIVREYYVKKGIDPQASLVKATLVNGAMDMGFAFPSRDQGWGRLDLKQSLAESLFYENEEKSLGTNESKSYNFQITSPTKLAKITLAWTDYPGSPSAAKVLVNDLDLIITGPNGEIFYGNDFTAPFNSDVDHLNNIENIFIKNPVLGNYNVTVKGYNVPNGPQPYALLVNCDNTPSPSPSSSPKPSIKPTPSPKPTKR